jgi:hypothetical protein
MQSPDGDGGPGLHPLTVDGAIETAGGVLNAEIARAVVRTYREFRGRGPTKARALYRDNIVVGSRSSCSRSPSALDGALRPRDGSAGTDLGPRAETQHRTRRSYFTVGGSALGPGSNACPSTTEAAMSTSLRLVARAWSRNILKAVVSSTE